MFAFPNRLRTPWPWVAAAAFALAACGGGGDDDKPDPSVLQISGTAATGAAVAGAGIGAVCANGEGSATTADDGTYTMDVEDGELPCVLALSLPGGGFLHSVATGDGRTATANITPLTDLVVAHLAGGDPVMLFDVFDAAAVSAAGVDRAVAAVLALLENAGIDTAAVANPMTAALVAAVGGTGGNAHDQALDALASKLAGANLSLTELVQRFGAWSPVNTLTSNEASVPADLLLAVADVDCPALRSGKYRRVVFRHGELAERAEVVTVDAAAHTVTDSDGTRAFAPVDGENDPCNFGSFVVAQSGMLLGTSSDGLHMTLAFPEQTIPVADLDGDWISLGWASDEIFRDKFKLEGGVSDHVQFCEHKPRDEGYVPGEYECENDLDDTAEYIARGDGGYDVHAEDGEVFRAYAFRTGGGEIVLVALGGDQGMFVATRAQASELPEVGDVRASWQLRMNRDEELRGVFGATSNEIMSVDEAAQSYVRLRDGTVTETVKINLPDNGYNYRAPFEDVPEFYSLPVRGAGMTASWIFSFDGPRYQLGANKP